MDMMGFYGVGPGMWLLGSLTMLLFWGGAILLIVWAVRQFGSSQRSSGEDPMAILRRRLAAGEITQEQFDQARRALQS
jgi:putative membrane protein